MIQSVVMMGGLGLIIGGALAFASKIFYVYVDPLVAAIDDVLPGANCGGCGFPGCTPNAEAIAAGKSSPDSCVAAGSDVAEAIAGLMGVSIGVKELEIARSGCYYGTQDADIKYLYDGISDCRAAALVFGGMKECNIGCLGMGTCVKACLFGALEMGEHGLPVVDVEKCTGCGACETICPKNIIRLTSVSMRIMREYTEDKCITPCQQACPTGIDIREYLARIRQGDNEGAVQVIKERNPFPTVIGRICPAPCESECRRQLVDESVGINNLKRFVCDIEMELGKRVQPYKAPETGRKVAVIGGGVEGLSTAFFTARLGHEPTVFEATSTLGGLLRIAIADERLPMDVLDWDIEGILEMGVNVKTGMKAGENFTVTSLLSKGYEAVFTGTGGWDSRLSRGKISEAATVFPGGYLMIDLLRNDVQKSKRIPCGRNVVIVGGGAMAPEAVRICKEQGVETITVVARKTADLNPFESDAVESMTLNGAAIVYGAGITKLMGQDDTLCQVECTDIASGKKVVMDAQTVILSSGRFPELVFIPTRQLFDMKSETAAGSIAETNVGTTAETAAGSTVETNVGTTAETAAGSTVETNVGTTAETAVENTVETGAELEPKKNSLCSGKNSLCLNENRLCTNENSTVYWEGCEIYKAPSNNHELGFLSPEDELSGYSAAVVAINGGRRAAATIHKLMYGLPVNDIKRPVTRRSILQGVTCVENVQIMPRNIMPVNDQSTVNTVNTGAKLKEFYKGYTPEMAQDEAERCLKCGLICYEKTQ